MRNDSVALGTNVGTVNVASSSDKLSSTRCNRCSPKSSSPPAKDKRKHRDVVGLLRVADEIFHGRVDGRKNFLCVAVGQFVKHALQSLFAEKFKPAREEQAQAS